MIDEEPIEIRIHPDGTVYFSALPAELLAVAAELNPGDTNIAMRLAAFTREDATESAEATANA